MKITDLNFKNSTSKSNSGLDSFSIAFLDTNHTENIGNEVQNFREYFKGNDFRDFPNDNNYDYINNYSNFNVNKNKSFNKSKNYKQEIMLEIEKNSREELQNILDKEYHPYQYKEILNSLLMISISIISSVLMIYFGGM